MNSGQKSPLKVGKNGRIVVNFYFGRGISRWLKKWELAQPSNLQGMFILAIIALLGENWGKKWVKALVLSHSVVTAEGTLLGEIKEAGTLKNSHSRSK